MGQSTSATSAVHKVKANQNATNYESIEYMRNVLENHIKEMKRLIECPVCAETMTSHERRPKNIGCGHPLCESCASQLINSVCPQCQRRFELPPGGCTDLPDIIPIMNMAEQIERLESEWRMCTSMNQPMSRPVSLPMIQLQKQGNLCRRFRHIDNSCQYVLDGVCKQCEEVMCSHCGAYDRSCSSQDRKHDLQPLNPLLFKLKSELKQSSDKMKSERKQLTNKVDILQSLLKEENRFMFLTSIASHRDVFDQSEFSLPPEEGVCRRLQHIDNSRQHEVDGVCKICKDFMCTHCGTYDRNCSSNGSRHNLKPLVTIVFKMKKTVEKQMAKYKDQMQLLEMKLKAVDNLLHDGNPNSFLQNAQSLLREAVAVVDCLGE